MNLSDYSKSVIKRFMGLWDRGIKDEVPPDHARDCKNVIFEPGQVSTRDGLKSSFTLGHSVCRRMFLATFDDTTFKILTIDGSGNLYSDGGGSILTVPGMNDMVCINMFNRVFISPISDSVGVPGSFIYVWKGVGLPRKAAGFAPVSGSAMVAVDGAAGVVEKGIHKIAVVYVTDTGFVTPPGPKISGVFTPTIYNAPGLKKINLSNIPIGPVYVTQRIILATKVAEEEFFFIPGGTINNNTATTFTIDFLDADLVLSADYLFDLLEEIKAQSFLQKYHNRLIAGGGEGDTVRVSRTGDPESISSVDGFISLPSERDGNTVKSCWPLRDVLYFSKYPGIYGTEDNSRVPSLWNVVDIDGGSGAFVHGTSTITASQVARSAADMVFMASKEGIVFFDGVVRKPELTFKIQAIWDRITFGKWHRITLAHDFWSRRIYALIPVDGSAEPNLLLVGDYSEGLNEKSIKWTPWTFPVIPLCIAMALFIPPNDNLYLLRVGTSDNIIYAPTPGELNDVPGIVAINSYYDSSLQLIITGQVSFFVYLLTRVLGTGTLNITLRGEDESNPTSPPILTLLTAPAREFGRKINFTGEKMGIKFGTNATSERFTLDRVDIYGKGMWKERPGA